MPSLQKCARPGVLWIVPVLSLGVTAFAWRSASTTIAARAEERFAFRTDVIESTIRERMRNYEDILRGAAGLFDSSDTVTRTEWQRHMSSIRPGVFGGGVQALGLAVRVGPEGVGAVESTAHKELLPLRVWPAGFRDEYYPIVYMHPFDSANLQILGYDISSESDSPARDDSRHGRRPPDVERRASTDRPCIVAVTANAMAGDT